MTAPLLDARLLDGGDRERARLAGDLLRACRDPGFFYLDHPPLPPGLCARVLDDARRLFAMPPEDKAAIDIRHSPHFRGYSEMRNQRDWREQVHFGPEEPAANAADRPDPPECHRLRGPNPWPARLGRDGLDALLALLDGAGRIGGRLLGLLGDALGLPAGALVPDAGGPPYLLLKLICYHPQAPGAAPRPGVAPHCDWSLITLLLQDDVGGLLARTPGGAWIDLPPRPGALLVNVGELVEIATGGLLRATPHQVRNPSTDRSRISVPIFINPALRQPVRPLLPAAGPAPPDPEHVHRVHDPTRPAHPFVFGESEWRRKGLGEWCHHPACCPP